MIALSLLALTLIFPIAFSGIFTGFSSAFWLFISNTGGVVGVPVISLMFCLMIAYYFEGWRKRMLTVTISLVVFASILGAFAKFNESFIKEHLKVPRPYAKYLKADYNFQIDKFYQLETKDARTEYLAVFFKSNSKTGLHYNSNHINQNIIDHWLVETGFSFPSGHTVNSFLMAFIIGYVMLFIYQDYKRKFFYLFPFIWAVLVAISRVAVGAHSSLDILLGALMGTLFGLIVVSTGLVDKLMQQKQ